MKSSRRQAVFGLAVAVSVAVVVVCGGPSCSDGRRGLPRKVRSVAISPRVLSVAGWEGLVVQPAIAVPANRGVALLGAERFVCVPRAKRTVMLGTRSDGSVLATWSWGPEWYFSQLVRSLNGKYVAVCLDEETTVTNNFEHESCRFGIIGPDGALIWLPDVPMGECGVGPRVAVSSDGSLLGTAGMGTAHNVQVIDTREGKVLWSNVPPGETGISDIEFAPAGGTLYVGGTNGWVHVYDVQSGKVRTRWLASRERKPTYGHRVSKIAVSPDGALLAAGTGPAGDVHVWDTKTGERRAVIESKVGTITVLEFSSDSSSLALAGVESSAIDIWELP